MILLLSITLWIGQLTYLLIIVEIYFFSAILGDVLTKLVKSERGNYCTRAINIDSTFVEAYFNKGG